MNVAFSTAAVGSDVFDLSASPAYDAVTFTVIVLPTSAGVGR